MSNERHAAQGPPAETAVLARRLRLLVRILGDAVEIAGGAGAIRERLPSVGVARASRGDMGGQDPARTPARGARSSQREPPLLVDAKTAAHLSGMGVQSWQRLVTYGEAPAPVRFTRLSKQLDWVAGLDHAMVPMTAKEIADAATSHLVKGI